LVTTASNTKCTFITYARNRRNQYFNTEAGAVLAGAIELVSPANKELASHRKAFVSKCETLLRQGIGLVIIDVVTGRKANLHDELLYRITDKESNLGADLYATSYRAIERDGQPSLDIWQEKINIGDNLPTVPFWLRGNNCLPLDLGSIYERTCKEQRIYANSALLATDVTEVPIIVAQIMAQAGKPVQSYSVIIFTT
jgi:Protein of unknown function (DUF4058)